MPLPFISLFRAVATVSVAVLLNATASSVLAAPASGRTIDGISCDRSEGAVFHIHQHLSIFDRGKPVDIPEDIGRPLIAQCLYWIHTHTPDGLIHIEAPKFRTFVLGNFFDIWGEPLSESAVGPAHLRRGELRVYVDGARYTADPRKIELSQHTDIVLEAGEPYAKPARFTDWKGQ